jgi:cellobiose epimerase
VISRNDLADQIHRELTNDIVPFWLAHSFDRDRGGFVGRLTHDLTVDRDAPKGLILNARILWSFSAFYRRLNDAACLDAAHRAYAYVEEHFWDRDHGGAYWTVDAHGRPLDTKKKVYGQAFLAYALAEYHRATRARAPLQRAVEVFDLLEDRARDRAFGGYVEAYERDWTETAELRLSDADMNEKKSMNAHLHVLEAFTGLHASWPDARLRDRLSALVEIFLGRIVGAGIHRFRPFFGQEWAVKSWHVSPGHDIEGSWLLCEAADAIGDPALSQRVRAEAIAMARVVLLDGVDADGGLPNEIGGSGARAGAKDWWPQAEAVVGFINAHEISGAPEYLRAAAAAWAFIRDRILDPVGGEWRWGIAADGSPDTTQPKISEWKCPYHNGRMCIEAERRLRTPAPSE